MILSGGLLRESRNGEQCKGQDDGEPARHDANYAGYQRA
jgi:hypothetical protein